MPNFVLNPSFQLFPYQENQLLTPLKTEPEKRRDEVDVIGTKQHRFAKVESCHSAVEGFCKG